jgi:hypothetical protein
MYGRILPQLSPDQQVSVDNLGGHHFVNDLDSLLPSLLADPRLVLNIVSGAWTFPRYPAFVGILRCLGTQ